MTFYIDNDTGVSFRFSVEELAEKVAEEVLIQEKCPYDVQINLLLTDNEGIQQYNRDYREVDRPTDVLSFPNLSFEKTGDFSIAEKNVADCFDPESGELILGDIIISVDKVREQAVLYGHSELREFAFLIAHSMLHLCGYDHMTAPEAKEMEGKQETILQTLGITRD